jgi:hypothetical protein
MQTNQQMLINFFDELYKEIDFLENFFNEILYKSESFAQKEASLLAIKETWEYSLSGGCLVQVLIERDYYLLWDEIKFNEGVVFIQAKDLDSAYKLGFIICSHSLITGGFIHSTALYDFTHSRHPFWYMIEEKKAKELGIEKSSDGYYYQKSCLLAFRLDKAG